LPDQEQNHISNGLIRYSTFRRAAIQISKDCTFCYSYYQYFGDKNVDIYKSQ